MTARRSFVIVTIETMVEGAHNPAGASELELLAQAIEQLPHAMFVKDREFRYVLVNRALVRYGGLKAEAILGKTDYDFLPKATADFYRAKDREVFASAQEVTIAEELLTDGEGERRVLSTRKVPLQSATGEVTHLIGVISVVEQALDAQSIPSTIAVVRKLPELPSVAVDGGQVQGALFNIIRNAIEAMPDGGTLTLDAELRAPFVVVRIADTGEGVPSEVQARLFEPLVTTKALGLGLGLVTARTLIEGQGGTLAFVGAHPGGACFEVSLPIAE